MLCLSGCMMEELDKESPAQEAKEYLVPIKMAGEILEIEEGPLTKAVTNDLYGLRISRKEAGATSYTLYANGLFDDISNIRLKVKDGDSYNMICSMIPDGKNIVYKGLRNSKEDCYFDPFNMSITNDFTYGQDVSDNIQLGGADLVKDDSYANSYEYIRYHGESSFIMNANTSISINMKKMVFGFKVVPVNLKEGNLKIEIENSLYSKYPNIIINSSNPVTVEKVFTFAHFSLNEGVDGDTSSCTFKITYTKKDGTFDVLYNNDISVKRNKMMTLTINIPEQNIPINETTVNITKEETNMQDGDSMIIDEK